MPKDTDKYILIFLHIPKAAGTTMNKIFERQYDKSSIFTMDGARVTESSDEVRKMPDERKKKIKLLKGHMAYGLHNYMPKPCRYFTLLRDPLERVISHYYYVIRTPNHYLYDAVTSQKMSLGDYVQSGVSFELNNGQTRVLGSQNGYPIEDETITQNHLNEAKNNLDNSFELVGLTERFDETLLLARQAFGWKNISYSRSNVTRKRPVRETVIDNVVAKILDQNKYDSELYAYACKLFDNSMSLYEGDFDEDLKKFRNRNELYSFKSSIINNSKKYLKTVVKKR